MFALPSSSKTIGSGIRDGTCRNHRAVGKASASGSIVLELGRSFCRSHHLRKCKSMARDKSCVATPSTLWRTL